MHGSVLANNSGMRRFAKKLGFEETKVPDDGAVVLVTKNL
jgi:RimJ/RimL family protein N-acetyltransferase